LTTILFDSRASFLERQSRLHYYFQLNPDKEIYPVSVFHDFVTFKKYKFLGNTELLSNYWEIGHKKYSESNIQELEEKYGIINLWNIVASDRFIKNWRKEEIVEQISFYVDAWEKIIEKYKPGYVISETVTGLWNYILYLICQHRKIKYLSIQTTKNTGRYYFSDDQYGNWPEFARKYSEINNNELKEEEINIAKEFIKNFKENHLVPPYMKASIALPNFIKYINFPRFFINLKKDLIQNWFYTNHDYKLGYRLFEYIYTLIRAKRILQSKLTNLFENPDFSENYVLFPVHFQPEATTDIWAPFYSDQVVTVKAIARSLPFGYYLYVKEHSALLGSKPIKFYKEILKIPNAKLINPWCNISELIRNSKVVTVITSTTGLESIIWNKPTIVFGEVFYNLYPYVHRVTNLNQLPELLKNAIGEKIADDDKERLAFIYLYSLLGYKSDIYSYRFSDDDIIHFADELMDEIAKQ
jgi:hypothetical protein